MNTFCFIVSEHELFESIIGVVVKRNGGAPEFEFICRKIREFWVLLLFNQFLERSNGSGPGDRDRKDAVGSWGSAVDKTVEFDVPHDKIFLFGVRPCLIDSSGKEVFGQLASWVQLAF